MGSLTDLLDEDRHEEYWVNRIMNGKGDGTEQTTKPGPVEGKPTIPVGESEEALGILAAIRKKRKYVEHNDKEETSSIEQQIIADVTPAHRSLSNFNGCDRSKALTEPCAIQETKMQDKDLFALANNNNNDTTNASEDIFAEASADVIEAREIDGGYEMDILPKSIEHKSQFSMKAGRMTNYYEFAYTAPSGRGEVVNKRIYGGSNAPEFRALCNVIKSNTFFDTPEVITVTVNVKLNSSGYEAHNWVKAVLTNTEATA